MDLSGSNIFQNFDQLQLLEYKAFSPNFQTTRFQHLLRYHINKWKISSYRNENTGVSVFRYLILE